MNKKSRHNALIEIISVSPVNSQAELAAELGDKGFKVTQASVSRDLDELGIIKQSGRYVRPAGNGESGFGAVAFHTAGENMIVGQCASGLASAITVRIDRVRITDIVGTIAGDDTIFIAVKDAAAQQTVMERLNNMFS